MGREVKEMNADTINAIMNMATVQNLSSQNLSGSSSSNNSGSDFSSVLSSMLGTSTSDATSALAGLDSTGTTVDYAGLLSGVTGGLRVQDVQSNAMVEALEALLGAEKPMVTDPVLAQLLQMMQGLSGEADSSDMLALIEQMQARLKEMLDEDGTAMAGQEVLALMAQLLPMFTGQAAADSMTESLNAAGGQAALDLMLQSSPEELVSLMGGETAQQAAQAEAQPQGPAPVLPPDMTGTSQAQADFSQMAQAATGGTQATQPAGDPQPLDPLNAGEPRVESVETENVEAAPRQTFADMLETGKAQGNFASAVRLVKDQMAETESHGFQEETDVDELQRQASAANVNQTVRTAQVAEAPEKVPEAPRPVPVQLQEAVTKGIANGDEQVVVKLNPEELGEVTIQMQRLADGGFVLNIIAKNPETQRMLAGELAQLQQNLRPMNVEVESITTEQQYQMANAQQQFGGQHQRSWKEMHGASYFGDEPLSAQGEQEQAPQVIPQAPASVLDAYI